MSSSVRWQQSVERMIADGVDTFIEMGPGKTLSGFMRKISRNVKMMNIENMADFFRYNIKKMNQDTTIGEEIQLVDNYIYILNVRFTGEIHFEKEVDDRVLDVKVPSMILQPIVENAVNYGIRNIGREGKIKLTVYQEEEFVYLSVWDNGVGMSSEKISQILSGELKEVDLRSNSNGIGLGNVIERLKLYTSREDVMEIKSAGRDEGTEFTRKVPVHL